MLAQIYFQPKCEYLLNERLNEKIDIYNINAIKRTNTD